MSLEISSTKYIKVIEQYNGMRLDAYLGQLYPGISRSKVQKSIKSGFIKLNGKIVKKSAVVSTNDIVELDEEGFMSEEPADLIPQNIAINIIYEDEYIVVINKQPGLVVHPGNGNVDGTLVNALLYHVSKLSGGGRKDRPGIVHRLDKNTSGVMVIAKNDDIHFELAKQFHDRIVKKEYIGISIGIQPRKHSIIENYISRSKKDPVKRWVNENKEGKYAKTEYFLIKYNFGISIVRYLIHTGRTHQIRVHSKYKGFPLVMDTLYNSDENRVKRLEPMYRPFASKIIKCFNRQALHAWKLSFIHPIKKEVMNFTADFPSDFLNAFSYFELTSEDIERIYEEQNKEFNVRNTARIIDNI